MTTLITLVGEQPIPNLLPVRYWKPERVLLVHSGGGPRGTEPVARRVARLIPPATNETPLYPLGWVLVEIKGVR